MTKPELNAYRRGARAARIATIKIIKRNITDINASLSATALAEFVMGKMREFNTRDAIRGGKAKQWQR